MGKRFVLPMLMALLGAVIFALPSQAQKGFLYGRGAAVRGRPHAPLRGIRHGGYLTGPRRHRYPRRSGYGYLPYFYPGYSYSEDYSEPAPPEPAPQRVVIVERTQPHVEAPPAPPPKSLLLELQGNRWVRVTDSGTAIIGSGPQPRGSAKATTSPRPAMPQPGNAMEAPRRLPPAVLVFRDGHKEEVRRYTIVGGTLYTSSNYWSNGSWTRKVPISELDVPATLKLNRERGAKFSLPSSPNVIVVRP